MTALNFPDSPSNGDTYQGYTYNSTKGTWAKPLAPDPAITSDGSTPSLSSGITGAEVRTLIGAQQSGVGTTAVVANVAALPGSASTGDMAFVTGTNRLYLWNGSGWYNIALINNTPTISGVSSSYALAIDGTATTVTITATDPEGLPITYSLLSDTSGNTATVTQGTGANTNVFTITPSTNTAHAGTFSLTFRASDGINIASAVSAFTLQFSVQNQRYTTALITSVGANNATNSSFDDKSTSDHTITTVGDVHQTTFSPYRHGGYSVYFDGNGDYLGTPNITMLAADQTVEFWAWHEGTDGDGVLGSISDTTFLIGLDNGRPYIWVNGQTLTNISGYTISNSHTATGNTAVSDGWHHYAYDIDVGASTTTLTTYVDGSTYGSLSWSNASLTSRGIGRGLSSGFERYFIGYIADLRIVSSRLYMGAFSPPTERLTAVTNTELLACHLPYIADGSTNGHSITVNGNTKTEPFSPYDSQEYSAASHLGSMYFDGTGDRLTFSHASDFSFGTGDFTIEFWMKTDSNAITGGYSRSMMVIGQLHIYMRIAAYHGGTDGAIRVYDETADNDIGNVKMFDDIWHHVAVVRESGTIKCWVDGKYNTGVSNTRSFAETSTNTIGGRPDGNGHFEGNITDIRVVKGTAVYTGTSNFTPPATPLTAITNTSLLLQGTDAGIIDKSQVAQQLKLVNDTKSSTSYTKFLSSSIYFDGTGDRIDIPNDSAYNFESGNSTLEMWVYPTDVSGTRNLITRGTSGYSGFILSHSGFLESVNGSSWGVNITFSSALTANSWQHIAVVRNGNTWTVYKDGTSVGTGTATGSVSSAAQTLTIGERGGQSNFAGYMSDIRLTKGLARYTSNFTPPAAALSG